VLSAAFINYNEGMQELVKKLWSNDFLKGGFLLTLSSFILNIFNYFFNFLAGRILGPTGFGEITALFSYVYIVSVPLSVISLIIIEKISSTQFDKLSYALTLEDFFWQRIRKWWFLLLPLVAIIPFIHRVTNLAEVTSLILIPYILISFMNSFYGSAFQGLRLFFLILVMNLVGSVVKLAGPFAATLLPQKLDTVLMFIFISIIFPLILSIWVLRKKHKSTPSTQVTKGTIEKRLVTIIFSKQVIITTLSILAITLFNNIDIIFVKKFFDPETAGIYSSWSLFAKIILYIVAPISGVSYIFFASNQTKKKENLALLGSLVILFLIGLASYLGYRYFGTFIITTFFGSKFSTVIPFLAQAGIYGSLYAGITFINNYFIAKKSMFGLILPIAIPFYFLGLFLTNHNLQNIFSLNIIFSAIVMAFYLLGWLALYRRS
jgi:O-antigen/teichoic acid export membrane protein